MKGVLLADYAEVLLELSGGNFSGKPSELIARALKLNPDEALALYLAGTAARERNDFPAVIDYWGRLLLQLQAGSEDARMLEEALAQAREKVGERADKKAAARRETISGDIILNGKLAAQTQPDDLLFCLCTDHKDPVCRWLSCACASPTCPSVSALTIRWHYPAVKKYLILTPSASKHASQNPARHKPPAAICSAPSKSVKPGSKNIKLVIDQVQP